MSTGLEVSLKKTEVLHQPTPQEDYSAPRITIGETDLKAVQQFTYLGCTISSNVRIDGEIDNRLAKANSAFWQAPQAHVEKQTPHNKNKNQRLQSCSTDHVTIWIRILGHLPTPPKAP